MCYSGICPFENHMGDCNKSESEKKFFEEKFGFSCFLPTCEEEEKYLKNIEQEFFDTLRDYRNARALMIKLSGRFW